MPWQCLCWQQYYHESSIGNPGHYQNQYFSNGIYSQTGFHKFIIINKLNIKSAYIQKAVCAYVCGLLTYFLYVCLRILTFPVILQCTYPHACDFSIHGINVCLYIYVAYILFVCMCTNIHTSTVILQCTFSLAAFHASKTMRHKLLHSTSTRM